MCRNLWCRLFGHRVFTVPGALPGWIPYTYCERSGDPLWGPKYDQPRVPGKRTDQWSTE